MGLQRKALEREKNRYLTQPLSNGAIRRPLPDRGADCHVLTDLRAFRIVDRVSGLVNQALYSWGVIPKKV